MNLTFIFRKGTVEFLKINGKSKLKIAKFNRDKNLNLKFKELNFEENNNLDKSIDNFLSNKNPYRKQNLKISFILEKIEKMIYKRKTFFDKKWLKTL